MSNKELAAFIGNRKPQNLSAFPPVIELKKDGAYFVGRYKGTRPVPQKNGRTMITTLWALQKWGGDVQLTRDKKPVDATTLEQIQAGKVLCSIAGEVLVRATAATVEGSLIAVEYRGKAAEGRNGNNPAHLFDVLLIEEAQQELPTTPA